MSAQRPDTLTPIEAKLRGIRGLIEQRARLQG
jgi:hypothetical protein